jgi:hypothetical protein
LTKKIYRCTECGRKIIYLDDGYWRHYRKPLDGHKPSPNQSRHDNNESLKLVGEIVMGATHPALYTGIKVAEATVDIYKRFKK